MNLRMSLTDSLPDLIHTYLGRLVERRVRHAAADVPVQRGHRLLLHGGLLQLLGDGR